MLDLEKLREEFEEELIDFRRELHMNPELSFKEYRTTEKIKEELKKLGIEILNLGMETGAVGLLRRKEDGPTIALRADIDALPIKELNDVPSYAGIYTGKNLDSLKKTGWRIVILALFVMIGTYIGSAIIAEIILRLLGQI